MAPKIPFRARASLLDRLVDYQPRVGREARPLRTLDKMELMDSIARNVSWIFNTRTSISHEEYDRRELTVLDFGIPDFGAISPANRDDRALVAKRLKKAVAAFEPRLKDVVVFVESQNGRRTRPECFHGRGHGRG